MKRKALAVGIILLFISIAVAPSINANLPIAENVISATGSSNITTYQGTLSGYVTDPDMNPIEGAQVRVYFHDTYRENYSDATGYYHVTDISICNCTKNATCSKEGYFPAWVWLSIWTNTTYDFVLTPLDEYCYPVVSGTRGRNGWYISPVNVRFMYDPDVVETIFYKINAGQWVHYTEPFPIDKQGLINFSWYYRNYSGESSDVFATNLKIDYTPPQVIITKERIGLFKWRITCNVSDNISGIWYVLFYFNGIIQFNATGPPYTWTLDPMPLIKATIGVVAYDMAGNSANGSVSTSLSLSQSNKQSSTQQHNQYNSQRSPVRQQMNQFIHNLMLGHLTKYIQINRLTFSKNIFTYGK
jgi:hypothetical protein